MEPARAGRTLQSSALPTEERRGTPFPVDGETYDNSIRILHEAVQGTRLEKKEKYEAIKRLSKLCGESDLRG